MQANSISNAYCACFRENKVQERGVPHYSDITSLTNMDYRPSLFSKLQNV